MDDTSEKGTVTPKIKQYARKHYQSDRQLMRLQSNGSTEYLDSEIRYLRELQEADDLREDDMETACLNLGLDLDYREYFINRLAGA